MKDMVEEIQNTKVLGLHSICMLESSVGWCFLSKTHVRTYRERLAIININTVNHTVKSKSQEARLKISNRVGERV